MSKAEAVKAFLALEHPEAILLEGFDEALVGIAWRFGLEPVALYDRARCVQILEAQGATYEEANDHVSVNMEGGWFGEGTPIFAALELENAGLEDPRRIHEAGEAKVTNAE
jgi:hypothetical protein